MNKLTRAERILVAEHRVKELQEWKKRCEDAEYLLRRAQGSFDVGEKVAWSTYDEEFHEGEVIGMSEDLSDVIVNEQGETVIAPAVNVRRIKT